MEYSIVKKLITNENKFFRGRPGWDGHPFIVLHTFNGAGASLYNWFQNLSPNTSSHYAVFIDANNQVQIEQYVEEGDTAYSNGDGGANANGISIEVQDNGQPYEPRDARLYDALAWLCADIIKRNPAIAPNEAGMTKHSKWTSTGCPGALDVNLTILKTQQLLAPPIPPVKDWRDDLTELGDVEYTPTKDYILYDINTGAPYKTYKAGQKITVHYGLYNWRLTKYSVANNIERGFKLDEIMPEVPVPPVEPVPPVSPPVEPPVEHPSLWKLILAIIKKILGQE